MTASQAVFSDPFAFSASVYPTIGSFAILAYSSGDAAFIAFPNTPIGPSVKPNIVGGAVAAPGAGLCPAAVVMGRLKNGICGPGEAPGDDPPTVLLKNGIFTPPVLVFVNPSPSKAFRAIPKGVFVPMNGSNSNGIFLSFS